MASLGFLVLIVFGLKVILIPRFSNACKYSFKKSKLSISQKRDKAIFLALPKNNKIKELLKSNQLTYGDIKSAMPALFALLHRAQKLHIQKNQPFFPINQTSFSFIK